MFRRRRRDPRADAPDPPAGQRPEPDDGSVGDELPGRDRAASVVKSDRSRGPWDAAEVADLAASGRLDLGGLWISGVEGMQLQVEVDEASQQIIAVTLVVADSAVQLQPFAAPRSEGIWADVRAEIRAGVTQQGGTVDEAVGTFGPELRVSLPVELPDGSRGVQPVRFVGVDGPRWFLRAVFTGSAAVDPTAAAALEELVRQAVIVRGGAPMAPREPIPLRLPAQPPQETPGQPVRDPLNPFARGPEITEIR